MLFCDLNDLTDDNIMIKFDAGAVMRNEKEMKFFDALICSFAFFVSKVKAMPNTGIWMTSKGERFHSVEANDTDGIFVRMFFIDR